MVYIILLLSFSAVFILCFELMPQEINFSQIKLKKAGQQIIYKISNINKKLKIENFRNNVQKKLKLAGGLFECDPDQFLTLKELSAILFFLIFFIVSKSFSLSILLLIVGFFLPDLWLNDRIAQRKKKIIKELPYFIDILTLSVEAGLDFVAAMNKIIQKSELSPLMEELRQMQEEIRVGTARKDTLHNLAKRVDIPEVWSFTSVLIQADNMGSPLGTILRTQSEQMHLARFSKAEKKAGEVPVKMLFPLIIFIFPVIFIVLFGPVILQLISQ